MATSGAATFALWCLQSPTPSSQQQQQQQQQQQPQPQQHNHHHHQRQQQPQQQQPQQQQQQQQQHDDGLLSPPARATNADVAGEALALLTALAQLESICDILLDAGTCAFARSLAGWVGARA